MVHIGPELLLDESLSTVLHPRLHPRQRTDNNHPQNAILPRRNAVVRRPSRLSPKPVRKSEEHIFHAASVVFKEPFDCVRCVDAAGQEATKSLWTPSFCVPWYWKSLSYKRRIKKHRNQNRQVSEKSSSGLFNRRAHGSKSLHVSCSQ